MTLWDDLKRNGEQTIIDICSRKQAESQHLEFKQKSNPNNPSVEKEDRRNLGKALSGFSNAMGGLLIWGIATARVSDETLADRPSPISDHEKFAQNIQGLIPEYLTPPNSSIEVHAIPADSDDGSGYLAIRIDATNNRPHMSLAPDHNKYFQRVGETTSPMKDFQVRDMLRIQTTPLLKMGYSCRYDVGTEVEKKATLILSIANESEVSAKYPYLLITGTSGINYNTKAALRFNAYLHADHTTLGFHAAEGCVIHPGLELEVMEFRNIHFRLHESEVQIKFGNSGQFIRWDEVPEVRIKAAVGCENTKARNVDLSIGNSEFETIGEQIMQGKAYLGNRRL